MRLSAVTINDYRLALDGDKLTVDGPNYRLAVLLGERWLNLIKTEEGRNLHVHDEVSDLLAETIGVPKQIVKHPKTPRPATERQIEFADTIGYEFPDDISFDEISIILTDYECANLFMHHVWKQMTGRKCVDCGLSRDELLRGVQGILQDQILTMRIRALSALTQLESSGLPCDGIAFSQVKSLLEKEFKQKMPRKLFGLFG